MNLYQRIWIPISFSLLFLASANAHAARHYLVELVVFSYETGQSDESWSHMHPPLDQGKMSRALLPAEITAGNIPSADKSPELKASTFHSFVERVRRDKRKKILLETRWIQEVKAPGNTTIVRITDLQKHDAASASRSLNTGDRFNNKYAPIQPGNHAGGQQPKLDGFVNFFLDDYYALEADLRYAPPYRPSILDEKPESGPATYRIHEQRKMKSGELNYYDHPKFGMLLLVTPVTSTPD